ncbi:MAG: hypothetical protein J6C53_01525 [Clostridia bacterium]|nr:hypothetical protein [Clostridia bacterium]
MQEIIEKIVKEIKSLKSGEKFFFTELFDKYSVKKTDKLKVFNAVMDMLKTSVHIVDGFKSAVVGLPFVVPFIKGRKKQEEKKEEVKPLPTNAEFYLFVNRGALVPKKHPKYNKRVYIKLVNTRDNLDTSIEIDATLCTISEDKFAQIKKFTQKQFSSLLNLSIKQTPEYLTNNALDGYMENITIILGGTTIQLNGAVADKSTAKACSNFIEKIYNIITKD